jgi:hypothetical protein
MLVVDSSSEWFSEDGILRALAKSWVNAVYDAPERPFNSLSFVPMDAFLVAVTLCRIDACIHAVHIPGELAHIDLGGTWEPISLMVRMASTGPCAIEFYDIDTEGLWFPYRKEATS